MMRPGPGHNNGPTMEKGGSWRRYAWKRARADLLPTLPIEVARRRVRRARELGIDYTPSVVFFDRSGKEVMRISAFVKTFHFQSVYAYVLERAYLHEPEFQRYISARADHIREAGFDTDIWGYESFHD